MQFIRLGKTEIEISSIIMGTWQAGKTMWTNVDEKAIDRAIRTAFESGINTFDTAEQYGMGHSERAIGSALEQNRDKVIYATKVDPNNLSRDKLTAACHRSLKNLQTDYIDLYQIHWPSGSWGSAHVPIEETMEAINDLKEQGKIRAIGLSNFSREQLIEALKCGDIQSMQPPFSLFWRQAEKEIIPFCNERQITVLAYSPMGQGILTGKFGPDHTFSKKDNRFRSRLFKKENSDKIQAALSALRPIAKKYNATLGQLALAWVMAHENVCAIAGARDPEQVLENAKAADLSLTRDALEKMDRISKPINDLFDDNPVLWA